MGQCKNRVRELFKSLYWSPIVNTFCQHRQLPLLILCVSYLCLFPSLLSRLDAGTGATWTTLRSALTLTGFMKVNRQGALNDVLTLVQISATKWACVVPQGWPGMSQGHFFYFFYDQLTKAKLEIVLYAPSAWPQSPGVITILPNSTSTVSRPYWPFLICYWWCWWWMMMDDGDDDDDDDDNGT